MIALMLATMLSASAANVFVNGRPVNGLKNFELTHVDVTFDADGNMFIVGPQYHVAGPAPAPTTTTAQPQPTATSPLTRAVTDLVVAVAGSHVRSGVEILVEARGQLPNWIDLEQEVSNIEASLPAGSRLYRNQADWYDNDQSAMSRQAKLRQVGALIHVSIRPKINAVTVDVMAWTADASGNVVDLPGQQRTLQPPGSK